MTRLTSPRTARQRLRERLAEERALFRLAVSRGRRRTVLTASHSTSARNPRTPSRFAARIGLAWEDTPEEVAPAASLRAMESSLRRTIADATASPAHRVAALAALPATGAAPSEWWFGRGWTDPGVPLHEGDIRTSYSRFSALENCALQYLFSVEMGLDTERSHSMWLGSLIHDIVDRVQRGEVERSFEAMVAELDAAWKPEVFANSALERQRRMDSEKMLRQYLADGSQGELLASEEAFEFGLNGATIRGRIDALFRVGERGVRVVDYKTSRNATTHEQTQRSLQLASYFLAMRRVPGLAALGDPEILELAYLFVPADEGYKHCAVKPDKIFDSVPEYEEWAETTILDMLEDVREERFAPSPEAECRFCSFKPICPLWPQGQEVAT
jgi:RecB family exonuclease